MAPDCEVTELCEVRDDGLDVLRQLSRRITKAEGFELRREHGEGLGKLSTVAACKSDVFDGDGEVVELRQSLRVEDS